MISNKTFHSWFDRVAFITLFNIAYEDILINIIFETRLHISIFTADA